MKKIVLFLLLISIFVCGCSSFDNPLLKLKNHIKDKVEAENSTTDTEILENSAAKTEILKNDRIETLQGWTFQFNERTNDYSLFFALLNDKQEYMSADVDVDIRIVDESGNELYKATRAVTDRDFGYYSTIGAGEQFLAHLRIKASEIAKGTSASGTVYITVYNETIRFDEVNCSAFNCLPVKDLVLMVDQLPTEVNVKDYRGALQSIIKIEKVTYTFDLGGFHSLSVTIYGTKTYASGDKNSYDKIKYKLFDSAGYLVDSGMVMLDSLDSGEKFKDDSITIYDIVPGETYTIQFVEYS